MTIKKNAVRKTTLTQKAQLMSGSEIERTLVRLAHEILEQNGGVEGLGTSRNPPPRSSHRRTVGQNDSSGRKEREFPSARSTLRSIAMIFPPSGRSP